MKTIAALCLALTLSACSAAPEQRHMSDLPNMPTTLEQQLAFTCAYEKDRLPKLAPEIEQLFLHARWLQKRNLLKDDPGQYPAIARLYRIATAYGHHKANHNLSNMLMKDQAYSEDAVEETLDLAEDLVKRGIPLGFYDSGYYLQQGMGVEQDEKLALKYFRHAADLGSPEAQYYVGDKLVSVGISLPQIQRIGEDMKKCAAQQGHAEAALEAAIHLDAEKNYPDALKYYQMAVKAGSSTLTLREAFLSPPPDSIYYLALPKDEERSRRYGILNKFLHNYSYLNPTVDDIDEIVPLPPAKLPPWDGKTKWQKAWDSGEAPPLPSEERIAELARAKGLDPATGRPLPTKAQP